MFLPRQTERNHRQLEQKLRCVGQHGPWLLYQISKNNINFAKHLRTLKWTPSINMSNTKSKKSFYYLDPKIHDKQQKLYIFCLF